MKRYLYLTGGFGNLLFQYTGWRHLSKITKKEILLRPILLNKNFLTTYVFRWHIHENYSKMLFSSNEMNNSKIGVIDLYLIFLLFLSKKFKRPLFGVMFQRTEENTLVENKIAYMGYYQNLNLYNSFFWDCVAELIKKMNIKSPVDRTVVHMRFGDSVWVLENELYYEKIKFLLGKLDEKIYFVSDDYLRCEEFASSIGVEYEIYSSDMISEFKFLTESRNCICAPSTFSWWASVMNLNEKNSIYMPLYFKERFRLESSVITYL